MRALLLALAVGVPTMAAGQTGPDVIVFLVPSIIKNGSLNGVSAYSMSTTSCNVGDMPAVWIAASNQHPVIAQNFYRLDSGRFEQIGMSWLKHAYCATNDPGCGTCQPSGCDSMGVQCSDTYGVLDNGQQTSLGPRSEVNPATGAFVYPWGAAGQTGDVLYKRLQIANSDLDPATYPSADYFAEVIYVTTDEPMWGTHNNNASYRAANIGAFDGSGYPIVLAGATQQQMPAIAAWAAADPEVVLEMASIPNDGDIYLASKATDLGGGVWNYEYALFNYNSDRAVGGFEIPLPMNAIVSMTGFHDVDYHSGEPFSGTDWPSTQGTDSLSWATEAFTVNADANAVRWGSVYNFRCDVAASPVMGTVTLDLFKTGVPGEITVAAMVPSAGCTTPLFIRGDMNDDGSVNLTDAIGVLNYLFNSAPAPIPLDRADANGDGGYNLPDAIYLLAYLFSSGPQPPEPFPQPGCI